MEELSWLTSSVLLFFILFFLLKEMPVIVNRKGIFFFLSAFRKGVRPKLIPAHIIATQYSLNPLFPIKIPLGSHLQFA